jgi:transglutaminase/protease-like cytokinesis protein 3
MKKTFILCALFFSVTFIQAQQIDKIDVIVAQYPHRLNTSEELAALINEDFKSDKDKARAIYAWIAMNVKFDLDAHFDRTKKKRINYKDKIDKAQKERKQRLKIENKALSQNLALAEGYTTLYKRVCELCSLYVYTIKGTAKLRTFDIGKQPRVQNHAWNVVQIEKEWYFVDVMLGAGTVDYFNKTYQHLYTDAYFFTPYEDFFLNHFPKDQGWLLLDKTADDFAELPLFGGVYLKNDFEIIKPNAGVLDLKGRDSIAFEIQSASPLTDLSY